MSLRICIFDDSRSILQAFKLMTDDDTMIEVAGSFLNTNNLLRNIEKTNPDVIIMDIDMGVCNGIDAVKEIRKIHRELPILMFTVFDDDDNVFNAICAGANGYLLKNTNPETILKSIEQVQSGGAPMSPGVARRIVQKFQLLTQQPVAANYELTTREKEILKYLTNGLSYKMVAAECNISFETVRTHIKNIYSKLHVASMTEAVAKAINERIV
jgi:DNA-binding NarL/FixJ family response regulator